MTQKLAVAVIHGVGGQDRDFAQGIIKELKDRFADGIRRGQRHGLVPRQLRNELVCRGVHWAPILPMEQQLFRRIRARHSLDWFLRHR